MWSSKHETKTHAFDMLAYQRRYGQYRMQIGKDDLRSPRRLATRTGAGGSRHRPRAVARLAGGSGQALRVRWLKDAAT